MFNETKFVSNKLHSCLNDFQGYLVLAIKCSSLRTWLIRSSNHIIINHRLLYDFITSIVILILIHVSGITKWTAENYKKVDESKKLYT